MTVSVNGRRVIFFLVLVLSCVSCGGNDTEAEHDPTVLRIDRIQSEDGIPISYQRKGDGYPVIILVHGWSCNRGYWRRQFDSLAAHYTVVSIDLAGHGRSGRGRERYSMEAFGADVKQVAIKEKLRHIILVGHSMGGAVILEAARAMPDRVMGLIGVDTWHDITANWQTAEVDSFILAMQDDFVAITQPWIRGMFTANANPTLVEWVVHSMSSADPRVAVDAFREYSRYNHVRAFTDLRLPVYLLNADRWPTNLAPIRQRVPTAVMTTMPGLGHFVMLEHPKVFLANMITAINYIKAHFKRAKGL
jgi:pimeloyl-ACP methyl ester carboxylesterase